MSRNRILYSESYLVVDVAQLGGEGHGVPVHFLQQTAAHPEGNALHRVARLDHRRHDVRERVDVDAVALDHRRVLQHLVVKYVGDTPVAGLRTVTLRFPSLSGNDSFCVKKVALL
eukprot:7610514-Pyramimonas_sp.AAC.1